jgi:hypothetical protein
MSHRAIRCLVGDAVKSLDDKIQFGYGRRSDFNIPNNKKYPFVWMLPLTAVTNIPSDGAGITKTWSIILVIIDIDKSGSTEKEYDDILDRMDFIGDSLIRRIDDWYQSGTDIVGTLTINSVNQTTIIKGDSDIHTGWLFAFQMVTSDMFDYCVDPDNTALYNGSYRHNQDTD